LNQPVQKIDQSFCPAKQKENLFALNLFDFPAKFLFQKENFIKGRKIFQLVSKLNHPL